MDTLMGADRIYSFPVHYWEIKDGDTINLLLDLGFDTTHWVSSRLMGLDAPETRYLYQRATGTLVKNVALKWLLEAEAKHSLLQRSDPDGWPKRYPEWDKPFESRSRLRYNSTQTEKDKYGRSLGIIIDPDHDISLNRYLLNQGIARPYDGGRKGVWTEKELNGINARCKAILTS